MAHTKKTPKPKAAANQNKNRPGSPGRQVWIPGTPEQFDLIQKAADHDLRALGNYFLTAALEKAKSSSEAAA